MTQLWAWSHNPVTCVGPGTQWAHLPPPTTCQKKRLAAWEGAGIPDSASHPRGAKPAPAGPELPGTMLEGQTRAPQLPPNELVLVRYSWMGKWRWGAGRGGDSLCGCTDPSPLRHQGDLSQACARPSRALGTPNYPCTPKPCRAEGASRRWAPGQVWLLPHSTPKALGPWGGLPSCARLPNICPAVRGSSHSPPLGLTPRVMLPVWHRLGLGGPGAAWGHPGGWAPPGLLQPAGSYHHLVAPQPSAGGGGRCADLILSHRLG